MNRCREKRPRRTARLFVGCIHEYQERCLERGRANVRRTYKVLRNCICGAFAWGVIASGRARRARRRALSGDVVSAIYFHRPKKQLFVRCVRWLIENGYTFISAAELLEICYHGKTPPKGAVWLSFDDGCKELCENVLPLVRQQGIPVTLFIPTGIVEGDGFFPWLHGRASPGLNGAGASAHNGARDALTVAELKQVASRPEVTVGSHTVSHAVTTVLTEERARLELGESKHALESWTHSDVKCFSYPEGRFDGRERAFLAEFGYSLAATTENALIGRQTDPYLLPRFSVGDEIFFPEAICNMVGVWRPAIDPLIHFLQRCRKICRSARWGEAS
ncbi:MAG TPA: polysaccharide deacetylase family protein, partial [Terriglobales bacterium]|nr:polysaccharide deacetylase family protein [Terriglobales bacterium]